MDDYRRWLYLFWICARSGSELMEDEKMTDPDKVREALLEFLGEKDPDAQAALLLRAGELGVLHMALDLLQELLSTVDPADIPVGEFDTLRAKVALLLEIGGYKAPTE